VNATDLRHALGLVGATLLTALVVLGGRGTAREETPRASSGPVVRGAAAPLALPDVPAGGFQRIVSVTLVGDGILAELAEPGRVVATTTWMDPPHPLAHRLAGLPRVDSVDALERIVALRPDLVLVAGPGDPARVARLRALGVAVVALSADGGAEALAEDVRAVAALLGAPERGDALLAGLSGRRGALARDGVGCGRSALYVSSVAGAMWGGAAGTSYHDVLGMVGLRDVATAEGLRGWPQLTVEQLLAWDPEVLLGEDGLRAALCGAGPLAALRACGEGGRVVELPARLASDPGPRRVEAAEALAAQLARGATSCRRGG
jgi:iron complex transport system substrate-binding protein